MVVDLQGGAHILMLGHQRIRWGHGPVDQNVAVAALSVTNRVWSANMVVTVEIRGNDTHDGECAIDQLVYLLNFPASTREIHCTLACTLMGSTVAANVRRLNPSGSCS